MTDDPKKPTLPRAAWSDAEAEAEEQRRASALLDAEDGRTGDAASEPPEPPEPHEVYGAPAPRQGGPLRATPPVPVYGAPPWRETRGDAPEARDTPVWPWAALGVALIVALTVALILWQLG